MGSNGLVTSSYAQLLSNRDNDEIEDENDLCPEDPDTQCTSPADQQVCEPEPNSCNAKPDS